MYSPLLVLILNRLAAVRTVLLSVIFDQLLDQ